MKIIQKVLKIFYEFHLYSPKNLYAIKAAKQNWRYTRINIFYKTVLCLLSLCIYANLNAISGGYSSFLPLPSEFAKKPIYYVYAQQLADFSCGYNVLFNACSLENYKVRTNKYAQQAQFKKRVLEFLRPKNARPQHATSSNWLHDLAQKLNLENFNYLIFEKQKVRPLFKNGIMIEYIIGTPKSIIEKMLAAEWDKRERALLKKLQQKLKMPCCLHFACHCKTQGVDHVILITLVRDRYARKSLYIFDNLNMPITANTVIARYIKWIIKNFSI